MVAASQFFSSGIHLLHRGARHSPSAGQGRTAFLVCPRRLQGSDSQCHLNKSYQRRLSRERKRTGMTRTCCERKQWSSSVCCYTLFVELSARLLDEPNAHLPVRLTCGGRLAHSRSSVEEYYAALACRCLVCKSLLEVDCSIKHMATHLSA